MATFFKQIIRGMNLINSTDRAKGLTLFFFDFLHVNDFHSNSQLCSSLKGGHNAEKNIDKYVRRHGYLYPQMAHK